MRKRLDDLVLALTMAMAVALVLTCWWALTLSISRAGAEARSRMGQAPVHIETPAPTPGPPPTPTPDPYDPAIPLTAELQAVLRETCAEHGVPVPLALGVIQVESRFQPNAVSQEGCYGLMQLNPKYFPAGLSPADNLRAGIEHLGCLLVEHGNPAAALTAYNAGHDTGSRTYADAVLAAAEGWEAGKWERRERG